MFRKKGALRNSAKFTGKHLCQSLFFNRVAGLRPANLLKKRFWHRCFPVNFAKVLITPFLTEHLRCSGKLRPREIRIQSLGLPVNFDVTGHNFPENYEKEVVPL